MRGPPLTVALLAVFAWAPPAAAEDWVWSDPATGGRAGPPIRFTTRASLWVAEFDRPSRACDPTRGFGPGPVATSSGLRTAQSGEEEPSLFCPHDNSEETAVGAGIGAMFRVGGPFHLTVGTDVLYTSPSFFLIKPQLVVAIPFALQLTWPHWPFRPILETTVTPVLYLTDGARDYTLGAGFGFAYRVFDFGDLAVTFGYQGADTLQTWAISFGVLPI